VNSNLHLFGGGYFLANPPGYALINGVSTPINPTYNVKTFNTIPNDPDYDPTTNYTSTFVNYGPVALSTGNGNNTMTGDMTSLSFNAVVTATYNSTNYPITGNPDPYLARYAEIQNTTFTLGLLDTDGSVIQGNTLTAGNGQNTIYGNVHDLNLLAAVTGQALGGQNYSFFTVVNALTGADVEGVILNLEVDMGHNTIKTGNGNNSIYGDIYSLNVNAIGAGIAPTNTSAGIPGSTGSSITQANLGFVGDAPVIQAGYNSISVANGSNTIAGDSHDITLKATGGYDATFNNEFNGAGIGFVRIFDGHNTISVNGSGTNIIAGSTFNLLLEAVGGVADNGRGAGASVFSSRTNPNGIDLTANSITVKGQTNDTIYGSAQHVTLEAIAGTVLSNGYSVSPSGDNLDPLTGLHNTNTSSANASVSQYRIFLGNNAIDTSQNTGKVTIFGDTQDLNFIAQGGTVNGSGGYAEAFITNNKVTMGGDTIKGGSGQTVIWANAQEVNIDVTQGHNNATTQAHGLAIASTGPGAPLLTDNSYFGTTLDPIYDVSQHKFGQFFQNNGVNEFARLGSGNVLTFKGDTIQAGSGDTIIHSHVGSFDNLSPFLNTLGYMDGSNPYSLGNNNMLVFGNDVMTGGSGHDTFAFDLMNIGNNGNAFVMQGSSTGHNEIKNFIIGQDSLEFDGLTKAQFLQSALVSDVAGPSGGTLVSFGSYTKSIGVGQSYNGSNNHGFSELNGLAIFLDPSTAGTGSINFSDPNSMAPNSVFNGLQGLKDVVSMVNYDSSDLAAAALVANLQAAGVEVVTTPMGSNISLGTNSLVSGAPSAILDIQFHQETIQGSLMIDGLHLAQNTAQGLINALGASHVIIV
jgi:hypothetical protein